MISNLIWRISQSNLSTFRLVQVSSHLNLPSHHYLKNPVKRKERKSRRVSLRWETVQWNRPSMRMAFQVRSPPRGSIAICRLRNHQRGLAQSCAASWSIARTRFQNHRRTSQRLKRASFLPRLHQVYKSQLLIALIKTCSRVGIRTCRRLQGSTSPIQYAA